LAKIPYDFCLGGLIFSLPLITIGAANGLRLGCWLSARRHRDRRLDHLDWPAAIRIS